MGIDELFIRGDNARIWQKYCGFMELSLQEFMEIQEDLLLEQIELMAATPIGRKLMDGKKPASVAEFREMVPLTTYQDYTPYLAPGNDEIFFEKPLHWVHTSGRGGSFKWVPYTERSFNKAVDILVAGLILACAHKKGEVNLTGKERCIQNLPPRPYSSGIMAFGLTDRFNFRIIPPMELAEKMQFHERIAASFKMALSTGVDIIGSLGSVLVKIGEGFSEGLAKARFSPFMLRPPVFFRLARGIIRSKIQRRPMLPKDLWTVKALICSGTDTTVFKDLVVHYWGKEPYQYYAAADASFIALQSWTKKDFTFIPYCDFIELIPEAEWLKWRDDRSYQPATVLLNEVKVGERYEIVVTTFYGMPFLRYRVGDLVKITALSDTETGIKLPQMVFESRADDIIDIAGFPRFDEKTVWQAINSTGVRYEDWAMRKEYAADQPVLHLYIELKETIAPEKFGSLLHEVLKASNHDYSDLEMMLGLHPIKVTSLSRGTFERYINEKRAAGFDLAHLKPPHMNASDKVIGDLLRTSGLNNIA